MIRELAARVILKADDYGNQASGINELVEKGNLSSVGTLIAFTGKKEAEALQQSVAVSPFRETSIVLHTNFQSGYPVSGAENVPSLVDDQGRFLRPRPIATEWEIYRAQINPDHVRRELDAQIEKFYHEFGYYPDALDSHNIILAVDPVAEIAMERAQQLAIPITFPYLYADDFGPGPLAAQVVHTKLLEEYKRRGIKTADYTYPNDNGNHIYLNSLPIEQGTQKLLQGLQALQPGVTQIVFHPVHPKKPRIPSDTQEINRGRKRDYEMLSDPRVSAEIKILHQQNRIASFKTL
ncbi:MAG TPA: ChbG/HpnK family deacetylase [Methylomirabilota bacterium]|nr:ChbG/HpnK family deacetylase [Methylomirabilota bacterium]